MDKNKIRNVIFIGIAVTLLYTFKGHPSWVELCSGLAFFLFGMQCMNDGLEKLAGSKLEQILARSTATPFKGLLFGIGSTMILQSTTVVSLLTMAFMSTGLITLAGGITIIIGANLGASSGVWLLALAEQSLSLGPFAYPMIVIGVLASFNSKRSKALGRVLLGIAFILLAIDLIKNGFSNFTTGLDFTQYESNGILGILLFVGIGLAITVVLQSSHATLMLVLTALGLNQIGIEQSFALAIGAIIGSAVATGFVGFLSGDRSSMRLAAAHVIFNVVTGVLTIILLPPLTYLVITIAEMLSLNSLIQLALFHTLFNLIGVAIFWLLQTQLAHHLMIWIPEEQEPEILTSPTPMTGSTSNVSTILDESVTMDKPPALKSRHLSENALASTETALSALIQELEYLGKISLEIICHTLYISIDQLTSNEIDEIQINTSIEQHPDDAGDLYNHYIKGIYSDILSFIGRIDYPEEDTENQQILYNCQVIALQIVSAVKNAKHLQLNVTKHLQRDDPKMQEFYTQLRYYILNNMRKIHQLILTKNENPDAYSKAIKRLNQEARIFDRQFRNQLFNAVRDDKINGFNTSSLMNDLNYANNIVKSLFDILKLSLGSHYAIFDHTFFNETTTKEST